MHRQETLNSWQFKRISSGDAAVKRCAWQKTPNGKLKDQIEAAKSHVRAKVEHLFRFIKQ